MSKDRTLIARGMSGDRHIVRTDEETKLRLLTYTSKGLAVSAIRNYSFYFYSPDVSWREVTRHLREVLEPVKVEITVEEILE